MKKNLAVALLMAIGLESTSAHSAEVCGKVVEVGVCWSGFNAVIAQMDNGDKLYLGDLSNEVTKARLSIGLSAKASQDSVCYQIPSSGTYCSITRGNVEWWVQGGSIY